MSVVSDHKRKLAAAFSILLLMLATGVAIASSVWNSTNAASREKTPAPTPPAKAVLVKTIKVDELSRPVSTQTFTGRITGRYDFQLAFRVSGKVMKRNVEVGQRVKAGDVLYELESDDFDLQLGTSIANEKSSNAAVMQAQQEERRLAQLLRERAISQSEYDSVKLLLDSSIAEQDADAKRTELSRRQLSYTKLVAERDGVVVDCQIEAGQVVSPGQAVVKIVQSNELEVELDLPEQYASLRGLEYGQVHFWTDPKQSMMVRLRELSPLADASARTFRARYTFVDEVLAPDRDGESWTIQGVPIKLGMTANLSFQESSSIATVAIPASAIAYIDERPSVWALREDAAIQNSGSKPTYPIERIEVDVQRMDDTSVHVRLEPIQGRTLVAAGVHKIDQRTLVRPW